MTRTADFRITRRLLLALFLATAPAAIAPAASTQDADEQRQMDWALDRGRLLFALDRAAWVATDDMLPRIPDVSASGIVGYIVDREPSGLIGIFFAREGDNLVKAYQARIGARGVESPEVFAAGRRPELTPLQARLARAVLWARDHMSEFESCGPNRRYNVAVVPPATPGGPVDIYLMTPQPRNGVFPFGRHHRITLAADGTEVARRQFTNTCLDMPAPPAELRARGAMMGVSHLLDPVPTEIHVFTALAAGMPVVVGINRPERVFEVTGEAIRQVSGEFPRPRRP